MNEKQLVRRMKNYDEDAWEEFIRTYKSKISMHCFNLTRNVTEAEDLYQTVCMQIFRSIQKFEGRSGFNTWIFTITKNAFLMNLRKHKHKIELQQLQENVRLEDLPQLAVVDREQDTIVDRMSLLKIIGLLTPRQTQFIFARYFDGMTVEETADRFKCGSGNVKAQVSRGIARLKKIMIN